MRARTPDSTGSVLHDGVSLGYQVHGRGERSVLLMPTWTIIHARFWKLQVPYLARRYRVITFDGPGNGRSDRTTDPNHYSPDVYADAACAVLDEVGAQRAVVVGLSLGAVYTLRLAQVAPERVAGVVLIGPALSLAPLPADLAHVADRFLQRYPADPRGWDKYNLAYWHDHYQDFVEFFFGRVFTEPHSTKPVEDAIAWALKPGPDVLEAAARQPDSALRRSPEAAAAALASLPCPLLVVQGTNDQLIDHQIGVEAAHLGRGSLLSMAGSGHLPGVRDPVRFNLELRSFIDRVAV